MRAHCDSAGPLQFRVVVMEDDTLYLTLLESLLRKAGYSVIITGNGREGMEAVRRYGADVVIADLFLPEQDGLCTIRQLKTEFPGIPILAMTAGTACLSLDNARDAATLIGADAFMSKPLNHTSFVQIVNSLCMADATA